MVVNLRDNVLLAGSENIFLEFGCSIQTCSVVLMHENQYEMLVPGKLVCNGKQATCSSHCLFTLLKSLQEDVGLLPACALIDGSFGIIPIQLLCVQPNAKLRKGKIVGHVEDSADLVQLASISQGLNTVTPPDDITFRASSSFDFSESDLTPDQQEELSSLLNEFCDIFSSGEGDLGRTSLAQHKIPTDDVSPKQLETTGNLIICVWRQPDKLTFY